MEDQAARLRDLVEHKTEYDMKSMGSSEKEKSSSMEIITVTSGKGGVGKTSFAVNFGIALSRRGKRVIIMDADFGLSNVDLVLGISTKYDITDLLSGEKTVNEIMVKGFEGLKFISGGSGLTELVNIENKQVENIVKNIAALENEADILIIDTGAGISDRVMKMVNASDETLLVLTPEPTSIMDAFAVIKTILASDKHPNIRIVVNRAETPEDAQVIAENFQDVVQKFLGVKVTALGSITMDKAVVKAIRDQIPFIIGSPSCAAAVQVNAIADDYLKMPREKREGGFKAFLQKLVSRKK